MKRAVIAVFVLAGLAHAGQARQRCPGQVNAGGRLASLSGCRRRGYCLLAGLNTAMTAAGCGSSRARRHQA